MYLCRSAVSRSAAAASSRAFSPRSQWAPFSRSACSGFHATPLRRRRPVRDTRGQGVMCTVLLPWCSPAGIAQAGWQPRPWQAAFFSPAAGYWQDQETSLRASGPPAQLRAHRLTQPCGPSTLLLAPAHRTSLFLPLAHLDGVPLTPYFSYVAGGPQPAQSMAQAPRRATGT